MAPPVRRGGIQAPNLLFEFPGVFSSKLKKNPGPLQSVLVTAVAAASAVLDSKLNVFKKQQQKQERVTPPQKKRVRDSSKVLRGPRRQPPVYSVPSPLKKDEWMTDPYEVKETRVRVERIKRRASGSDANLEHWIEQQAKIEADAKAKQKSLKKKIGRESSGASVKPKKPDAYYNSAFTLMPQPGGRRDSRQLSVRNRTIEQVSRHVKRELAQQARVGQLPRVKNKWETCDVNCIKRDEDLDVFERVDAHGNLIPHKSSLEDSEREFKEKPYRGRTAENYPMEIEPRDRPSRRARSEPFDVGKNDPAKKASHQGERKSTRSSKHKSKRHSSYDDLHKEKKKYRSKITIDRRAGGSTTALEDKKKHRKSHSDSKKHRRHHREREHELRIKRTEGGSTSTLGKDDVFQPDFYPSAPPLNLGIREVTGEDLPYSPSTHAELLKQLAANDPALLAYARSLEPQIKKEKKLPSPRSYSKGDEISHSVQPKKRDESRKEELSHRVLPKKREESRREETFIAQQRKTVEREELRSQLKEKKRTSQPSSKKTSPKARSPVKSGVKPITEKKQSPKSEPPRTNPREPWSPDHDGMEDDFSEAGDALTAGKDMIASECRSPGGNTSAKKEAQKPAEEKNTELDEKAPKEEKTEASEWLQKSLGRASAVSFSDQNTWFRPARDEMDPFAQSHFRDLGPSPTRDSLSAFTIRETALCDSVVKLGTGISQTRIEKTWEDGCAVDLSTKPKQKPVSLLKRLTSTPPAMEEPFKNFGTARGDAGQSKPEMVEEGTSDKKFLDMSKFDNVTTVWKEIFYEEPNEDSEGRPFFSFVPILGHPLFGEDKWAKKAPTPPAEKPPLDLPKAPPMWWL